MSGPVDVRGVIRATVEQLRASGDTGMVENLMDADAAVAELIEECERLCKVADGMKRTADDMSRRSPVSMTLKISAANILSLRALLARVGGAA